MEVNLAGVFTALGAALGRRPALVHREQRRTWHELAARSHQLAHVLVDAGLGCHHERAGLAAHQSGQDHLALYLHSDPAYVEAMVGAYGARVAPCNVHPGSSAEELRAVLADARARGIVFHSRLAPTLAQVLGELEPVALLLQVDDGTDPLLAGARWYHEALEGAPTTPPDLPRSPDDLSLLYTGGTTGAPKGVMWRQADLFVAALGGRRPSGHDEFASLGEIVDAAASHELRTLVAAPLTHGTGQWATFHTLTRGGTVVLADTADGLDAAGVWAQAATEAVQYLVIVGDAFARPLLDHLDPDAHDLSALTVIMSGGAPLSPRLAAGILERLPAVLIVDGMGSSETGGIAQRISVAGLPAPTTFRKGRSTHVLADALDRELEPGEDEVGWLARSGRLPLGLLGHPEATRRTYPVIDGVRYAVPGDRARLRADGTIEVQGRDWSTINSGGEKVFAEEVEAALRGHPDVYDALVVGRPSARWGQEVVAVVQARPGSALTDSELVAWCRPLLAGYKRPKAVVLVDHVHRASTGKGDYRWARAVVAGDEVAGDDAAAPASPTRPGAPAAG